MWTDETVETAKKMWAQGESASVIADKVGAVSRSAVLGLLHRHGLSRGTNIGSSNRSLKHRADRGRIKRAQRTEAKAPDLKPLAPKFSPEPLPPLEPVTKRRTFEQLQDHECRWPVGDPKHDDFGFCGLPRVVGKPYCEDCCRRARPASRPTETVKFVIAGALAKLR
jgi:GcrA cell cycle regulator